MVFETVLAQVLNRLPPGADNPDMAGTGRGGRSLLARAALALLLMAGFYVLALAILVGLGFVIFLQTTSEQGPDRNHGNRFARDRGDPERDSPKTSEIRPARTSCDVR